MTDATYIPRLVDSRLELDLKTFGAVLIDGPKWCGKTTTGSQKAASQFRIADPRGGYQNRRLAKLDPMEALRGERPRLIDEWQEVPEIWDAVRFECDEAAGMPGQFMLTGSATPLGQDSPMHSGAGRVGRLRMDTLTLQELGISNAKTSLKGLFGGASSEGVSRLTLREIADLICKGGWPVSANMDVSRSMRIARSYIDAVVNEDMERASGVKHNPEKVRRLIYSLARNESTLATQRTIMEDSRVRGEKASSSETVSAYLHALKQMFFVDDIPSWSPALRSPVRIRAAAKRHLADTSLAAAALGASPSSLVKDLKTLGCLFESLVIHDVLVYARLMDATVWHYRDDSNLEVDLIVQLPDGSWGAFEIKLGEDQEDKGARSVLQLNEKMVKRGEEPASVLAVIVGVGSVAHRRGDGVHIVPIDALGA